VEEIEAAGIGSEALALEELKKKLASKGYFDQSIKKRLPALPYTVGVISSPTGAVIQDIKKVIWRRYPGMPILLYPSAVQGKEAAESIIKGFAAMENAGVSVVILARGGGSAEDLSAFNREDVVGAIHECAIPVISAVGHETDVTLSDLAADQRAATPSMAAEMAVPVKEELLAAIAQQKERLVSGLRRDMDRQRERLGRLTGSYVFIQPQRLFDPQRDRLARFIEKMTSDMDSFMQAKDRRFRQEIVRLETLSPLATLARGYAICRDEQGRVLYDSAKVETNRKITVNLSKGALVCKVEGKTEGGTNGE
jgi:exodeoxyribonuclease VII large subunit